MEREKTKNIVGMAIVANNNNADNCGYFGMANFQS